MTTVANMEQEAPVAETNPLRIVGQPIAVATAQNVYYGTITKVTKTQTTATYRSASGIEKTGRFVRGRDPRTMTEYGFAGSYMGNGAELVVADDPRLPRWTAERAVTRAQIALANATRGTLPYNATLDQRIERAEAIAQAATRLTNALKREKEVKS